jgi:ATP-dependent RNA helicase DeaD
LPDEIENYTHRSGRTARAGKTGVSISIINGKELGKIRQIEKTLGKRFVKAEIPTGFDVCEKQLFAIVHKVHNVQVNETQIEQYLPRIMDEFKELSKEEIIKRFASLEFNSFLEYYKNAPDLNAPVDESRRMESSGTGDRFNRTGMRSDFTRLFINLGSVDGFSRGDLLGYICNTSKISGRTVGKIDVKGVYSFFEVPNDEVVKVQEGFKGADFQGRDVRIEISGDSGNENRGGASNYKRREGGGERREGGFRRDGGNREGGNRERAAAPAGGGGFRDFSGKRREDRSSGNGERRRRF